MNIPGIVSSARQIPAGGGGALLVGLQYYMEATPTEYLENKARPGLGLFIDSPAHGGPEIFADAGSPTGYRMRMNDTGDNGHIYADDSGDYDGGAGKSYSWSSWVQFWNGTPSGQSWPGAKRGGSAVWEVQFSILGTLSFIVRDSSFSAYTMSHAAGTAIFSDNTWHHWCGTFDEPSGVAKLYFDGVERDTVSGIDELSSNSLEMSIGIRERNNTGQLRDLDLLGWTIHDRALPLSEVQLAYNGGTPVDWSDYQTL